MSKWLPIESAPYETPVLAIWNGQYCVSEKWNVGGGDEWYEAYDGDTPFLEPDAWMPLPDAPKCVNDSAKANNIYSCDVHDDEPDPYAATRRAIVRAAAEIGRSMKAY